METPCFTQIFPVLVINFGRGFQTTWNEFMKTIGIFLLGTVLLTKISLNFYTGVMVWNI